MKLSPRLSKATQDKRTVEIWMNRIGDLVFVVWNACGCHPNDVFVCWGKKFNDAYSTSCKSKSSFTRAKHKRGWQRLDRWFE